MLQNLKLRWRLFEIWYRITYLSKMLEGVPIFWNFQYMKLPEHTRKEIMGWIEEVYDLGIEEANILLKLKKYDLYKEVLDSLEISHKNICELKLMCLQEGVSF